MRKTNSGLYRAASVPQLQFACLALLGVMEFLWITVGQIIPRLGFFAVQQYMVIPGLLFLGISLTVPHSRQTRRNFLVAAAMIIWLGIAQSAQRMAWEDPKNISMWWSIYLLAFPYASAVDETGRRKGLDFMSWTMIGASCLLCIYTLLLVLGILPGFLAEAVYWDGPRLLVMWHPDISSCVFMIGVGFCLGYAFRVKNPWGRAGLLLAAMGQFLAMALTNCRTSILMTCVMAGGAAFLAIYRKGWKRFLTGILAALVICGALFAVSDKVYDANHERLLADYLEQLDAAEAENAAASSSEGSSAPAAAPRPTALKSTSGQGTFLHDLKTFNGRTGIWKAVVRIVRKQPEYLLRGTVNISEAITLGGNSFVAEGAHNDWLQMLIGFGIPGLLFALYFTFLAVRGAVVVFFSARSTMWQKCMVMIEVCLLVAAFLGQFIFSGNAFGHFTCVIFFLLTGYLDQWQLALRRGTSEN